MARKQPPRLDPKVFLQKVGHGKSLMLTGKRQLIFSQGDAADAVFYVQTGQVKLTVLSEQGKEAITRCWIRVAFSGKDVSPDTRCAWPRRLP